MIILLLFKKRILGLIYWFIISILFLICFIYSLTISNPLIWKSMWCLKNTNISCNNFDFTTTSTLEKGSSMYLLENITENLRQILF